MADDECPECCCILEICCSSPAQAREAMIVSQMVALKCPKEDAVAHTDWVLERFALAPKSFKAVIAEIVAMARKPKKG